MQCTQNKSCGVCGGPIARKDPDFELNDPPTKPFICLGCNTEHEYLVSCSGEVKKIFEGGKEVDCVCEVCDTHYRVGAVKRGGMLHSFAGL